jgi:HSP20 family protein
MRSLVPWRLGAPLSSLHEEIDDLFTRFFDEEPSWSRSGKGVPALESFVKDGELTVRADLPGIDPKNVELSVEGDRLMIKGERKSVHEEKDRMYREVTYGRFERSVALPHGVDSGSIKATYKDGVLEVTMKAPKELEPKKVPIAIH